MKNNLRSLSTLFSEPLPVDSGNVTIDSIHIPKIQRSYAQGRRSESEIRKGFLSDLFTALSGGNKKELNFIYGSIDMHSETETRIVILDGQQRLTTLWLLTWYIYTREQKPLPTWMATEHSGLYYDTRDTTSTFTNHLAKANFNFPTMDTTPSEEITKIYWFSGELRDDPSVDSMLRMIDAIHDFYNKYLHDKNSSKNEEEKKEENLHLAESLDNILFYVQPLENFGLTEDLYVKMNARGLQLRPFENFKADLVEWTKKHETPTLYDRFIRLLDRDLTDFFYNSVPENSELSSSPQKNVEFHDKEFNARFFRFFYRYFAWCRALDSESIENTRVFIGKGDEPMNFFYDRSEKEQDVRYLGFYHYAAILKRFNKNEPSDIHNRATIETICRVLSSLNQLKSSLKNIIRPGWIKSNTDSIDFFASGLQQRPFAVLGGLFSFLSRIPVSEDAANYEKELKKWMRIVNNIAENTDIDNLAVMSNVMRQLDEIASRPGFVEDVYKAVASTPFKGNTSRAVSEEIKKARYIMTDSEWETLFMIAESHRFLRGMILFFIPEDVNDGMTKEEFKNKFERIQEIFDGNGISEEFRKDALLVRAMIAELSRGQEAWEEKKGLKNLNISQYDGADRSLRNTLSGLDRVSNLMKELTNLNDIEKTKEYLRQTISLPITADYPSHPEWTPYLRNAVKTLLTSLPLYEWMEEERRKNSKRIVRIDWWGGETSTDFGQILVAVPRAWYAKVNIDTNRHEIMRQLLEQEDFSFVTENEKEFLDKFGNVFDSEVMMKHDITEMSDEEEAKTLGRITLKFTRTPSVEIHASRPEEEIGDTTRRTILYPDNEAKFNFPDVATAIKECKLSFRS